MIEALLLASCLINSSINVNCSNTNVIYSNNDNSTGLTNLDYIDYGNDEFLDATNSLLEADNLETMDEPTSYYKSVSSVSNISSNYNLQKDDFAIGGNDYSTIYDKTIDTTNETKSSIKYAYKIEYLNVQYNDSTSGGTVDIFYFTVADYKAKVNITLFNLASTTDCNFRLYSEGYKLLTETKNGEGKIDYFETTLKQGVYYIQVFSPSSELSGTYSLGIRNNVIEFKEDSFTYTEDLSEKYKAVIWTNSFVPYNASIEDDTKLMYIKKPASRANFTYPLYSTDFDYDGLSRIIYLFDKEMIGKIYDSCEAFLDNWFNAKDGINYKSIANKIVKAVAEESGKELLLDVISMTTPAGVSHVLNSLVTIFYTIANIDKEQAEADEQKAIQLFLSYMTEMKVTAASCAKSTSGLIIREYVKFDEESKVVKKPLTRGREIHYYYYLNFHNFASTYNNDSMDFVYGESFSNLVNDNGKSCKGDFEYVKNSEDLDEKLYGGFIND